LVYVRLNFPNFTRTTMEVPQDYDFNGTLQVPLGESVPACSSFPVDVHNLDLAIIEILTNTNSNDTMSRSASSSPLRILTTA